MKSFVILSLFVALSTASSIHDVPASNRHTRHARSGSKNLSKRCEARDNRFVTSSAAPSATPDSSNNDAAGLAAGNDSLREGDGQWDGGDNGGDWNNGGDYNAGSGDNGGGDYNAGNDNGGGDYGSGSDNSGGSWSTGGTYSGTSACGDSGASSETTATSGPMGSLDFLNCGIESGGWNPPAIYLSDLKAVSLDEAIQDPNSPFQACKEYIPLFDTYATQHGIPPIMMASFALQESTCNPATTGGGGEAGLMQLTSDKCGNAPGGNCYDVDYNIRTATEYFAGLINNNGGTVLEAIGQYNGWFKGMTYNDATDARYSSCCRCQRNLDYAHQFLNGWMQNINAYSSSLRLGRFFNLDVC
ncbi:glycoside hydrolase family 23 protein [Cylindrobasidium torrendii FP15055 ss-10]|uniref:Glycoside hydrolase family 23 protein n=1 Tax=Cylindrobasidium torrendii FP15055 ss-10 TaxID=1314674 RepID=A0A0D7BVE5_9AGAR|nr:glycoside hydrolase family 23 protein [Cylindrobasidium torrendii FP15055 ss-10]